MFPIACVCWFDVCTTPLAALCFASLLLDALSNHTVGVYSVTPYAHLSYHASQLHVLQLLHRQQEREG